MYKHVGGLVNISAKQNTLKNEEKNSPKAVTSSKKITMIQIQAAGYGQYVYR